jgi:hypothetical protein
VARLAQPGQCTLAFTRGGHCALAGRGGAVRDDSPVDEVWRHWWVKLDQEEGESPGNERESGAHRSGLALVRWQTGGGVVASDEG